MFLSLNAIRISNCAALASASAVDTSELLTRALLVIVHGILYLVFAVMFGIKLGQWDDNISGHCYNSRHLALPDSSHPMVDRIYLGITCLYMFVVLNLAWTIAVSRYEVDPAWGNRLKAFINVVVNSCRYYARFYDMTTQANFLGTWNSLFGLRSPFWYPLQFYLATLQADPVLFIAMVQFPLHLYFIICLRLSNEPLLSNGSDENEWGFGQIYSLIMSAGLLIECVKGYFSAYNYLMFHEYHINVKKTRISDCETSFEIFRRKYYRFPWSTR